MLHEVSGARDAVEWSGASFDCNIGQVVDGPPARSQGALAQLVARFHGMEEVRGSSPLSSTIQVPSHAAFGRDARRHAAGRSDFCLPICLPICVCSSGSCLIIGFR